LGAVKSEKNEDGSEQTFSKDDTVYVTLEKNRADDFFSPVEVSKLYPKKLEENRVALRGKIEHVTLAPVSPPQTGVFKYKALRVKYGIEDYFVPQNEGKYIERNMNNLHAEVSVRGKNCALSKLFLSGVEIKFY
jgi:hypothetical protein